MALQFLNLKGSIATSRDKAYDSSEDEVVFEDKVFNEVVGSPTPQFGKHLQEQVIHSRDGHLQ